MATQRKPTSKKRITTKKKLAAPAGSLGPIKAPGTPQSYRARVRMYRHGLGDCFLLTFPRPGRVPFQMLIDCGALARDAKAMTAVVEHIRDTAKDGQDRARLDVVVGTHEHKDHLSGFNQARKVFNDDIDFGAVWMSWAENLSQADARKLKEAKKVAKAKLEMALSSSFAGAAPLAGVSELLGFTNDDDSIEGKKVADAVAYLKLRGKEAQDLRFLEPGSEPFVEKELPGFRFYVLGPPRDPRFLKTSAITQQMKKDDVIYHLSRMGTAGLDSLGAAVAPGGEGDELCHPFAAEHRIARPVAGQSRTYFAEIQPFVDATYDKPSEAWRRIDEDWLSAFGQLALDLDNDTNNTSLVLAIECIQTRDILLFPADAQVGNWQSWATVNFQVPNRTTPCPAHELLGRTVFYKVGHHCSHNATLKAGGLELMTKDNLVAFIPLDKATASKQGKTGWDMPATPLFNALRAKTKERVVISDVNEQPSAEALQAGVIATPGYIDYFLR
ncbi:hypothetical protein DSM104443_00552 [Usitatibacter rugosus]|uniref:Metallo-beta-lactamase superfamily protein n=1 Tax=Usitatibacter rugosus TaxID=2732067 RepID=A0A6M4GRS2_9PROT|nr:hypothetical protein [Usitatibacter rugosus]QJR09508.1 hypothetical protein DSM104443_00552 [Usitatibacter rugosus]